MKQLQLILVISVLLFGCGKLSKDEQTFLLQGAWILQHTKYPTGTKNYFAIEGNGTYCLVYDRDSMLYECMIVTTPSGLVFMPTAKYIVTLIDRGGGDLLYLENGDPHPLTICNDSTITIQRNGVLYTWVRSDDIYQEWGAEIRNIIAKEMESGNESYTNRYVLSAKERQQERTIQ